MNIKVFTDGGARGNPGPAAAGVVIYVDDVVIKEGKFLGVTTNNQAEYQAVEYALEYIYKEWGSEVRNLEMYTDSLLMQKQLTGEYKVKDLNIRKRVELIQIMLKKLNCQWNMYHVPRTQNAEADAIVNAVLDSRH